MELLGVVMHLRFLINFSSFNFRFWVEICFVIEMNHHVIIFLTVLFIFITFAK